MRKLPAVEDAKTIMKQGTEWGMWKWMLEKTRVRQTADLALAPVIGWAVTEPPPQTPVPVRP